MGQVNSINEQKFQNKERGQNVNKRKNGGQNHKARKPEADQSHRCYSYSRFGHSARDACCPAKDKGEFVDIFQFIVRRRELPSGSQESHQPTNRPTKLTM